MVSSNPTPAARQSGWFVLVGVLLAAGIAVRGIGPTKVVAPEDRPSDEPRIEEPMQFLGKGARLRVGELDAWVSEPRRMRFKSTRELLFHLEGCPQTGEWLDSIDGQRTERLLTELRGGTREEALAALTLALEIGRVTQWNPGITKQRPNAERFAGLVQEWLRVWAEKGVQDPVLVESTLAAALVYGRLMRVAWQAPVLGSNAAPYERAKTFLLEITGSESTQRTHLGEALQARFALAMNQLRGEDDVLEGFDTEAKILFPDLLGDCDE